MSLDVYEDIENCFAGGWSDGLPVIPPYGSLVDRMLGEMGWKPTEVIGEIKTQDIEIRAEHVAAAAVMAGCKFEYARVLRPLSQALMDPLLNLSGVEVTTGGAAVLVIVSGPVVAEMGFAHESNALGSNNRANATIGRFAQMVRYFCGSAGGTLHAHGTMGHPGRITFCIAEHPKTVWPPFHTQQDLPAGASAVSVMSAEGPNSVNNHYAETPEGILDTIVSCLAQSGTTNYYWHTGTYLVVIGPDHMALVGQKYTREQVRKYLYERAVLPTDELKRLGRIPRYPREESKVEFGKPRSPFHGEHQLVFIECGAPGGKFSAVIPGWVGNRRVISRLVK
jgi:hypothetical protein